MIRAIGVLWLCKVGVRATSCGSWLWPRAVNRSRTGPDRPGPKTESRQGRGPRTGRSKIGPRPDRTGENPDRSWVREEGRKKHQEFSRTSHFLLYKATISLPRKEGNEQIRFFLLTGPCALPSPISLLLNPLLWRRIPPTK